MSRRRKDLGDWGEDVAAAHLVAKGFRILDRRLRLGPGEIDLLAQDGETLVFVEVKALHGGVGMDPAENVHAAKRRRLVRAARAYLARLAREPYCRFDVVTCLREPGVRVEHLAGAFTA